MRIVAVLALCAVGAVAAFLLLRPSDDAAPLPAVRSVTFDAAPLSDALAARERLLRAEQSVGTGELDALLTQDPLDLSLDEVSRGGLTLHDVAVRRRGSEAAAEATVDPAQLATLAPVEVRDLRYDEAASRPGSLVARGTAKAFGLSVPVTVRVTVQDGAVVAEPEGLPVGRTVLFDDPRIRVTGLRVTPADGGRLRARVVAEVRSP